MQLADFGLTRRPFRPTPAPDLFVPLPVATVAGEAIQSAFDAGDGIALLDGPSGCGKTVVALRFLESLKADGVRVFVPSGRLNTASELHQAILFDLGKPYRDQSEHELRLAVTDLLLADRSEGKRGVFVLDEAHLVGDRVLEEVRLLDNLDGRGGKAVFTLLVGLPDLRQRLADPAMRPLAQRIGCRARLDYLSVEDSGQFIREQLTLCGGQPDRAFTDEGIDLMAEVAGGVSRVLNRLATAALALAGSEPADAEAVYEAADRMGLLPAEAAPPAEAEESTPDGPGKPGGPGHPGATRGPKQKARKRRAA
jgi:type II secretory pathway predicted ATPase ExeA